MPGKEYKTDNICAYNVADAMIETKKFMTEAISPDTDKWKWGDLIVTRFRNTPWSHVKPLEPYFNRYHVVPGNAWTPQVAEYGLCK